MARHSFNLRLVPRYSWDGRVLGHEAGIHASFSDIFHYLKGVIPIAVEADKGRFVMPIVASGATFTEQTVAVDC